MITHIFIQSLYNLNTESDTLMPSLKAIIYNDDVRELREQLRCEAIRGYQVRI